MGLRISTNYSSLFAQRSLSKTQGMLARTLERLASGKRINRAADDASGLAVANGLTMQVRGLSRAVQNTGDTRGVLETAASAISSQIEIVHRMRELSVQAANGTLSDANRSYLNAELSSLFQEFTRITDQTSFNGTKLLDGSFSTTNIQVGTRSGESISLDIAALSASSVFTKTVGNGTFQTRKTYDTPATQAAIDKADFNGDGILDLVVSGNSSTSIYFGYSNGSFGANATYTSNSGKPVIADFNGDGYQDIANVGTGDVSILINNGNGTFKTRTTYSIGASSSVLAVADFNNDGFVDLVSQDPGAGSSFIALGTGSGSFRSPTLLSTVISFDGINEFAAGDLNKDGNMDLVSTGAMGDDYVWLGNGSGGFGSSTGITLGSDSAAAFLRLVDFNDDGKLDLVETNSTDAFANVLLGNGNGTFGSRVTYATGAGVRGMDVNDINGDGIPDIITADSSNNTISILLGRGNGTFAARKTIATGTLPYGVTTGDFNDDLGVDIASLDRTSATISVNLANISDISGVNDISIANQADAQNLLNILDNALENLSTERSNLGAVQNRLDYAQSSAAISSENISMARSTILDADIAVETADLTRGQILQSAGVSVLGQANLQLNSVLSLLSNLK